VQDSKPPPFAGVMFTNKNAVNVGTTVYEVMTSCKKLGKQNHRQMKHATILFGRYKVLSWNKLHFSCQNSHKNKILFCHTYSSCVEGCSALGFHCFHIFKQKFPFKSPFRLYNHYAFLDCQTLPQLIITHGPFQCTNATYQLSFLFQSSCYLSVLTEAFRRHGGSKV